MPLQEFLGGVRNYFTWANGFSVHVHTNVVNEPGRAAQFADNIDFAARRGTDMHLLQAAASTFVHEVMRRGDVKSHVNPRDPTKKVVLVDDIKPKDGLTYQREEPIVVGGRHEPRPATTSAEVTKYEYEATVRVGRSHDQTRTFEFIYNPVIRSTDDLNKYRKEGERWHLLRRQRQEEYVAPQEGREDWRQHDNVGRYLNRAVVTHGIDTHLDREERAQGSSSESDEE